MINTLHKFTDKNYKTEKELKQLLKTDEKVQEELDYRFSRSFYLPFKGSDGNQVFITQTPWILQKEIHLMNENSSASEYILYQVGGRYNTINALKEIADNQLIDVLYGQLAEFNIKLSKFHVKNLVQGNIQPSEEQEIMINKIVELMIKARKSFVSPRQALEEIGISSEFLNTKNERYYLSSMTASHDEQINSILVKASIMTYNFLMEKQFGHKRDMFAYSVALYSLLRSSNYSTVITMVKFFDDLISHYKNIKKAVKKSVDHKGDVTYIYLALLKFVEELVSNARLIAKKIKTKKVADDLSIREKNMSVKDLLTKYPEMTLKQARFYVAHHESDKTYTVQDYISYNSSSYEAARYSMNNLTDLGFYFKEKLGKKFIYRPLEKN